MAVKQYIQETRAEFKHVRWPSRIQAVNYTLLVVGISIAVSVFLFVFDILFLKGIGLLVAR